MLHTQHNSQSAFTLIELLVVISIISLLVAILLPALAAARKAAQSVQCMSNQRQLGIVFTAYQNDHDGLFPSYWANYPDNTGEIYMPATLVYGGYLESGAIFACPSFGEYNQSYQPRDMTRQNYSKHSGAWNYMSSYGYNVQNIGGSSHDGGSPAQPARAYQINNPGQTYVTMDARWNGSHPGNVRGDTWLSDVPTATNYWAVPDVRHSHGLNILWADMHVSFKKIAHVNAPYDVNGLGRFSYTLDNFWDRK